MSALVSVEGAASHSMCARTHMHAHARTHMHACAHIRTHACTNHAHSRLLRAACLCTAAAAAVHAGAARKRRSPNRARSPLAHSRANAPSPHLTAARTQPAHVPQACSNNPPRTIQVKQLFKPLLDALSRPYAARVNSSLAAYGLRYDDLYDPLKDEVRVRVCVRAGTLSVVPLRNGEVLDLAMYSAPVAGEVEGALVMAGCSAGAGTWSRGGGGGGLSLQARLRLHPPPHTHPTRRTWRRPCAACPPTSSWPATPACAAPSTWT